MLVDSASGEYFVIDSKRKEIIRAIPSKIVAVEAAGGLNVSLKSSGATEKIAGYRFPDIKQVTVSIGYTLFDRRLTLNQLITQADIALYYCKTTTRNAVHGYQELVEKGLVAAQKDEKFPQTETP